MPVGVCIHISSISKLNDQKIEFYRSDQWAPETEVLLFQQLHELISAIRPIGKALHLDVKFEVSDALGAIAIINRKVKHECVINNHKLSLREIEVLGLIMLGCTNIVIAEKLFISFETVKSHRKNILAKTGAKNTAALINYYHQTFFEK
jgi:DNA-binding NarL/FixJ family response regulator